MPNSERSTGRLHRITERVCVRCRSVYRDDGYRLRRGHRFLRVCPACRRPGPRGQPWNLWQGKPL